MPEREMERRAVTGSELRAEEGDEGPVLSGYAAVFDQWSENLGGFRERIAPGAFAAAISHRGADIRALWNHDRTMVLGRTTNGSLTLAEDDHGLRARIVPPPTTWAADAVATVRRGDVTQMSFEFYVADGGDEITYNEALDIVERTLRQVELTEVSPVTFPAYPQTSVIARQRALEMAAESQVGADQVDRSGAAEERTGGDGQGPVALLRRRLRLQILEMEAEECLTN